MGYAPPLSNFFDKIIDLCAVDGVPVTSLQLSSSGSTPH